MQSNMTPLAFILLDGLTAKAAQKNLGFLEHLVEKKQATKLEVIGELPSLSRPMYETIFTGLPVYKHGIVNNQVNTLSTNISIFDLCQKAGLKCLAFAYYWISELYIKTPFHPLEDVYLDDNTKKIQKGMFYYEDQFPDSHLYSLAYQLIKKNKSDFVFIHPMNIDLQGHLYGCQSQEYHMAVSKNDLYLSMLIPFLRENGYSIMIGADHGMNEMGLHGGNEEIQRNSYLYIIDEKIDRQFQSITTLQYAPIMCKILGLQPSQEMQELEVKFNEK